MKKISLKIKLTLKYTGCIFVATGIALFFATMISGTDAQTAKAMAKVILPIVFIASLAIGYFLVREVLKRTADLAESAAEICRTKDFSRQLELEESDAEFERLQLTLNELLEEVREEGHFAAGSMLPKVQAAMKFVRANPSKHAVITSLDKAIEALNGESGTVITYA